MREKCPWFDVELQVDLTLGNSVCINVSPRAVRGYSPSAFSMGYWMPGVEKKSKNGPTI
jgi:hypothetical protein